MKYINRFPFAIISVFSACLCSFAALSFAQVSIAPTAAPPAVSIQRKVLPKLPPAAILKRDLQTGKITGNPLGEMPATVSGQIEGYVYEDFKPHDDKPLGGARIKIRHNDPNDTSEVKLTGDLLSFSNGEFYYMGILPGKYRAYIDPKQLNLLHYTSTPPFIDFMLPNKVSGDTKDALNFTLKRSAVIGPASSPTNTLKVSPQQALTVYDHGDPTAEEQYIMEMINRARANPPAEGIRLANSTDPDVVFAYQYWATQGAPFATPANVKSAFATYPAQPPLAFNKDLIAAARSHSQDMIDHNYQGHTGSDGSMLSDRLTTAGYDGWDGAGENVAAYSNSIEYTEDGLEIDFGQQNQQVLGHRQNIINFTGTIFTEIGIGALHGGTGEPNVGTIVTTQDFGHIPGNVFITGVVYGDDNHNVFYDIGEGLAGVTITVEGGSTSAISSTSGGYAIPYTDQGTVTVTASGGPLTSPISHTVTLNGDNVKVDFIQGFTGFPDKPILIAPVADTIINTDTAHFSWSKATGEIKYWIQVATDSKMSKIILKDSTLISPSRLFPKLSGTEKVLLDGTTYYWQVKSKNVIGWGQFSTVDSFSVGLPPNAVVLVSPSDKANVGTTDVIFNWRRTTPDASDYLLEVATDTKFTNIISNDTLNLGVTFFDTTFSIAARDLQPQTTYYWRVLADNDNGWNAPGVVRSFTTGGVSSVPLISEGTSGVIVSPNPTSGQTHIRFSLGKTVDVSLRIFGVRGANESLTSLGMLQSGSYDIIWNAKGMPAGVYLFELSIGDNRRTGRIIVIR